MERDVYDHGFFNNDAELARVFVRGRSDPADDGWRLASSHLLIEGAFNGNSTSVAAWKAFLRGLRDDSIRYLDPDFSGSPPLAFSEAATGSRFAGLPGYCLRPSSLHSGSETWNPKAASDTLT